MRHQKHRNQLNRTKEHREALLANLGSSLIISGRIRTTLKKAKALRPYIEKLITLAKKGGLAQRRLAISRLRDKDAVRVLFNERAVAFSKRAGGYTRIYKLADRRIGDAAEMALIEFVGPEDVGYRKARRKGAAKSEAKADAKADASKPDESPAQSEAPAKV